MNNLIWTVFDFIFVHLVCKFQDDPIKAADDIVK